MREASVIYNNELLTNIRDESTFMKIYPAVVEFASSIWKLTDKKLEWYKRSVQESYNFDSKDLTYFQSWRRTDAIVWIFWIRISPGTFNDGIRQLIALICCVQESRRRGHNIEIYPIICVAIGYCKHDDPFQCPAFHQLSQILCDPYLTGRRVCVVSVDSTRFAFHPDNIQQIQRHVNHLHRGCKLVSPGTSY
jgi:hypothetical protein